jgi:Domain of unknown function (DUF4386)
MTRRTLHRPTYATIPTLGAGSKSMARHDVGSPPNDVLLDGEINRVAEANRTIRKASTTAGVGLLAMSLLSALGYLIAVKGQLVPGNAARTARNIAGHEGLFRFGIVSLYLVAALDVVVAWALYGMFQPVSEALSKLAAWLRVAYAVVFIVAISQLIGALRAHAQALHHINTFTDIWDAGLVLFGLSLFLLAYLAYRSRYVPKLLGLLLAIAGLGYIFDSVVRALVRGSSSDVSAITGIGEFVFALWLVIRGRRIASSDSQSNDG